MKKFLFFGLLCVFALTGYTACAQGPAASPFSKVEQKVGMTDVTIEYSRPSMKGRAIMGSLVPYGANWRTGANSATKITFSNDVTVEGQSLMAGSYALFTMPGKDSWGVMFYKYDQAGAGSYGDKQPAVKVTVKPQMMDRAVETFLINIDELRDNSATLQLIWEKTLVPIKLGVK